MRLIRRLQQYCQNTIQPSRIFRRWLPGTVLLLTAGAVLKADMIKPVKVDAVPSVKPLDSGLETGAYVPTFYSRVVTGPLMNKSMCYVCRNGRRPVVMVLVRDLKPEHRSLMRNLDRLTDIHRADGFRGFGVMISDNPFGSISKVQTFAFNHKVSLPLTVAPLSVGSRSNQNIHPDAEVTVVLYRNRAVVEKYAFRAGELTYDRSREVIRAVRKFIVENTPRSSLPMAQAAGE